jgi:hypothetical protein
MVSTETAAVTHASKNRIKHKVYHTFYTKSMSVSVGRRVRWWIEKQWALCMRKPFPTKQESGILRAWSATSVATCQSKEEWKKTHKVTDFLWGVC